MIEWSALHKLCAINTVIRRELNQSRYKYSVAILIFCVAFIIRILIIPADQGLEFLTFYPAADIAILVLGPGPGILVMILGGVAANYAFMEPYWAFKWPLPLNQALSETTYYLSGIIVCFIVNNRRNNDVAIQTANNDLEHAAQKLHLQEMRIVDEISERNQLLADLSLAKQRIEIECEAKNAAIVSLGIIERKLYKIFDQSAVGMSIYSATGDWLEVNHRLCDILGYERGAMGPLHKRMIQRPEGHATEVADRFMEILGGEKSDDTWEKKIVRSDGKEIWVRMTTALVRDSNDCPEYFVTVTEDISIRKNAEDKVKNQLVLFNSLMESIANPIFYKDLEGRYLGCNSAFENFLGHPRSKIIGSTVYDMSPASLAKVYDAADKKLMAERATQTYEAPVVYADGSQRSVRFSKAVFTLDDGSVAGLVGVMLDVTEYRQTESSLRKLSLAVEQCPVSIIITDTQGVIEYVNPCFEKITQYYSDEVVGNSPSILKSGYTPAREYADLWQTISSGTTWRGEFHNRRKDGSLFWERVVISPLLSPEGKISNYIGVKEDITNTKKLELEMIEAKETAEAGNQAKTHFLAMMGHELRTPLNAIIGFSELLKSEFIENPNNDRVVGYCTYVLESASKLQGMIDDILDFSKISSGKMELVIEEVLVNQVVDSAVAAVRVRAQSAHIMVMVNLPVLSPVILADEHTLFQALVHLLSNAIKFSHREGRIDVRLFADDIEGLVLTIADNGVGITQENLERVLRPFEQAESSLSRRFEGTGIGLTMAIRVIERHGGTLSITSEPGVGTEVAIRFPRKLIILASKRLASGD